MALQDKVWEHTPQAKEYKEILEDLIHQSHKTETQTAMNGYQINDLKKSLDELLRQLNDWLNQPPSGDGLSAKQAMDALSELIDRFQKVVEPLPLTDLPEEFESKLDSLTTTLTRQNQSHNQSTSKLNTAHNKLTTDLQTRHNELLKELKSLLETIAEVAGSFDQKIETYITDPTFAQKTLVAHEQAAEKLTAHYRTVHQNLLGERKTLGEEQKKIYDDTVGIMKITVVVSLFTILVAILMAILVGVVIGFQAIARFLQEDGAWLVLVIGGIVVGGFLIWGGYKLGENRVFG